MLTDAVFYSATIFSMNLSWTFFVVVLVGNSRGSYTQLPQALNAAIVLLWKMKGSVWVCGGSVYDHEHNRPGPRPSVVASCPLCLARLQPPFLIDLLFQQ